MENIGIMPIMLLKKRFLKVLYEKILNKHFLDYEPVLCIRLTKFFKIQQLSEEEYNIGEKSGLSKELLKIKII